VKQIVLTPKPNVPENEWRKVYDWLIGKAIKNELPFSVVMRDTDAEEQYGVLIHCGSQHQRDAVLEALSKLEHNVLPATELTHVKWTEVETGKRIPETVGMAALMGARIGRVFE